MYGNMDNMDGMHMSSVDESLSQDGYGVDFDVFKINNILPVLMFVFSLAPLIVWSSTGGLSSR